VYADPTIAMIPHFLAEDEVAHLLDITRGRWKHSRVGAMEGDYSEGKESNVRTSSSCTLRRGETAVVRQIEDRVCELARIDRTYLENLAPVKYEPGQQYRPHHDGSARPITVFIYLSDLSDDAEGETYFPVLNKKVRPRKGCAIMWANPRDARLGECKANEDSRLLHAALPCKSGVKFGVNCFFSIYPQSEEWEKCSSRADHSNPVCAPASSPHASSILAIPRQAQYPQAELQKRPFAGRVAGPSSSLYRCATNHNSWAPLGAVACN
jgi:prolyl 4-hydroxylase